jgi:hypothetical protein
MSEQPDLPLPFDDDGGLRLVRDFLRREFRDCQHRDYWEFHTRMQVFVIETERGMRHTLAITQRTLENGDLGVLLNQHLVTALEDARGRRVTLTPRGPRE